MQTFPKEVKFCKTWRPYQARVLDELEAHLDDNHLHVIAAPGAGKTVLGLEVMIRLQKPTLILAPTLAIRDQWADRFLSLFCGPSVNKKALISKSLKTPLTVTVSTYQALYSALTGDNVSGENENSSDQNEIVRPLKSQAINDALVNQLKTLGIQTIIVDEAHHLRSEWWRCLIHVKDHLENPTIVALTATPPYDVSGLEWDRYQKLCGPVDSEISVPELVREGNLCPHQDYVYISTPDYSEKSEIKEFRERIQEFYKRIIQEKSFIEAIASHPYLVEMESHMEAILNDPAFFTSMIVFLAFVHQTYPEKTLKILGIAKKNLPLFNLEILEILLGGCFFAHSEEFSVCQEYFQSLARELRRIGAIDRRKVILRNPKKIARLLMSSVSKLESILQIVKLEKKILHDNLRMVILTDYIRQEDMPTTQNDMQPLKRIGVVTIFEKLRRASIADIKLGVLSGALSIIPKYSKNLFLEIASSRGVDSSEIKIHPLNVDGNYCTVEMSGNDRHGVVSLVTQLFNRGGITVLIGTKSLLGEGWDAPSINALVLASFVGSCMLSNQMRGRSIRMSQEDPAKVSNIWHLVCVEEGQKELSDDLEVLTKRFKAFVGVSFQEKIIKNGIERLGVGHPPFNSTRVKNINNVMVNAAVDREALREKWTDILALGKEGVRLTEEVRTASVRLPRQFVFYNTIHALFFQGIFWGGYILSNTLQMLLEASKNRTFTHEGFYVILGFGFFAAAMVTLPPCIKSFYLFLKHGPVSSSMHQIGMALIRSLNYADFIKTPIPKMKIETCKSDTGFVSCSLAGGTTYENSLFIDALQEILNPMDNPRYLLQRISFWGRFRRMDYHAVPSELSRKQEFAKYFLKMWRKYVGPSKLIYTRDLAGRAILIKARANSLSNSFLKKAERIKSWR